MTREEQETVIRKSAADDAWDIWTCDPKFIHLLERRGYEPQPDHQSKNGKAVSIQIPYRQLTLRSRMQKKRPGPLFFLRRLHPVGEKTSSDENLEGMA